MSFLGLMLLSNSSIGQVIYSSIYKVTTNEDSKQKDSGLENAFLNGMQFIFNSNENICFLKEAKILESVGIDSHVSGETNIYIDYKKDLVCYNLDNKQATTFSKLTFKKSKSTLIVLGMTTTKYTSSDGNIILYTTKELPWFVQPCLISKNQFNESIVKYENLKTKKGFEIIEFKKIESDKFFKDTESKLALFTNINKKTEISPFFRLD